MDKEKISFLIDQHKLGLLTTDQEQQLEEYIEKGWIQLEQLEDLHELYQKIDPLILPDTVPTGKEQLNQLIHQNKAGSNSFKAPIPEFIRKLKLQLSGFNLAYGLFLLVLGLLLGILLKPTPTTTDEINRLSSELNEVKEMMMLSLIEKESTPERLKAVNLSQEMDAVSDKIIDALFQTLNLDDNVNVRLSSLEALYIYADNPGVRKRLIQSIPLQESPLVQIAMAEAMVALQEKKSVDALKLILQKEATPPEVKEKIRKSIDVLL